VSKISRGDIAAKLREIQTEVDSTAEQARPAGITIGASAAALAVGLAFVIGQRKARRQTTIVEVRRA
jgi:hypothetical protein